MEWLLRKTSKKETPYIKNSSWRIYKFVEKIYNNFPVYTFNCLFTFFVMSKKYIFFVFHKRIALGPILLSNFVPSLARPCPMAPPSMIIFYCAALASPLANPVVKSDMDPRGPKVWIGHAKKLIIKRSQSAGPESCNTRTGTF